MFESLFHIHWTLIKTIWLKSPHANRNLLYCIVKRRKTYEKMKRKVRFSVSFVSSDLSKSWKKALIFFVFGKFWKFFRQATWRPTVLTVCKTNKNLILIIFQLRSFPWTIKAMVLTKKFNSIQLSTKSDSKCQNVAFISAKLPFNSLNSFIDIIVNEKYAKRPLTSHFQINFRKFSEWKTCLFRPQKSKN